MSYFGKIASFLFLEFSFLGIYRCRLYIATVVVDSIILQIEKSLLFSSKIFSISRNQENNRSKGQHINDSTAKPHMGPNRVWVNLCDTKKLNLKNQSLEKPIPGAVNRNTCKFSTKAKKNFIFLKSSNFFLTTCYTLFSLPNSSNDMCNVSDVLAH